jgi:2'-5' RNA ligase
LWLGVQGELEKLTALHLDALATFGPLTPTLSRREREFQPHVTLARSQTDGHFEELARELRTFSTPHFEVRGLSLYESSNHVYRAVHHAPLRLLKADAHR